MSDTQFSFQSKSLYIPVIAVVVIWFLYFIEIQFGFNFNKFGIYPQTFKGLRGVIFSPFIHSDIKHLFNNSIPLLAMLWSLYYFYSKIANKVLIIGLLVTGLLTWSFARPSYHIGASGMVYMLVSFIFFSGIFRKFYRLIALSLAVVFLYGSMIWYIFPVEERISWEGHLSGFIVGLVFAILFRNLGPQPETFEYTKNEEFESLFDENGNYSPPEPNEDEEGTLS
ncbi:Membrane associated serine protease, rhomboid family [Lutibacter agarilyticus]|uniref:Membrane associated serine protease, rhomboid family n=1 Tax=Lutibacter agarilyticus TaxID=1109740 RepID=A0A238WHH3_9FLAO|nr:rhomboid family intramembrane serine protease [Lutibacter agarilyticus]SNR45694.1 Membrane associated serine protease, rhomboid family [Lutibacter agarilyticus]